MFASVLVANRGEIALRVLRTLRSMGIASIAVYSDADVSARHVREADRAVRIGPAPPAESYLDVAAVVGAARASGAEALHPGYGFLSENPALAEACAEAGIAFVGPPVAAIRAMGDKIRAKQLVSAAGVPVVPGCSGAGLTDEQLAAAAVEVGLPVLIKPSAGGGGKGMRRVDDPAEMAEAIVSARREAIGAFGDGTLLVERWVERPRHIEIQVLFDSHDHGVHLGERECSLQRRHQKVVEETPSVLLDEPTRQAMGRAALDAARSVGYVGAGTVEMIVSAERPGEHFFMEMNTRLQVEHPVTEAVTGIDLVEWQLRVAAGEPLGFGQEDIAAKGHAIEARVYAEDPDRGFLPASGRLLAWVEPEPAVHPGVRVDSGVSAGDTVGTDYDPMLAKVVAHGRDRPEALARLRAALGATTALGVATNVGFLRRLLAHPDVDAGRVDTGLIERELAALTSAPVPDEVLAAAALHRLALLEPSGPVLDPWDSPSGWRSGGPPAETVVALDCGGRRVGVGVRGHPGAAEVRVGDGPARPAAARVVGPGHLEVEIFGGLRRFAVAGMAGVLWLGEAGETWRVSLAVAERGALGVVGGGGVARAPMPGTVRAVHVAPGERVEAGRALVTVEAMKMEHAVVAPTGGVVAAVRARVGQTVAFDEVLVEVTEPVGEDRAGGDPGGGDPGGVGS